MMSEFDRVFLDWKSLAAQLSSIRIGKKVVFTNGCFDLLHRGHVTYLNAARAEGDILVLGINSDSGVRLLKGPTRPVQSEADRAYIISHLRCVDFVTIFSEETPLKLIEVIKPDVLVKGGDWSIDKIVGADFVQSYSGVVKSLTFVDGKSTTAIISKINSVPDA